MQREFQPGFRLSTFDVVVLATGLSTSLILMREVWQLGIGVACVVLHFFLFCNVFRIQRRRELMWAAWFVTLALLSTLNLLPWTGTFLLAMLVSAMLIACEMRRPSYHGLFWKSLNPNLENFFRNTEHTKGILQVEAEVENLKHDGLLAHHVVND